MQDNVISFPKESMEDDLPRTAEEARNRLHAVRKDYIDSIVEEIQDHLQVDFIAMGFYNTKQEDLIYLSEVLKATLYRSAKLDHFLHDTIDESVVIGDYDAVMKRAAEIAEKKREEPLD